MHFVLILNLSPRACRKASSNSQDKKGEQLDYFMYFAFKNTRKDSKVCCPLIGQKNTKVFWHQSERRRAFGTGLVRHCLQGPFSPFFTFRRAIFFPPFRLSLAPNICPWVSEDAIMLDVGYICIEFLGPVQTSNIACAEPNNYLGRPKLLSSTVDSDGRTLHASNLIHGEKKYNPYCLKQGNKLKKV